MNYGKSEDTASKGSGAPRRTLTIIALLLAVHFLLLFFADSIPSQKFLFLFFFLILVMLPGFMSAKMLFPEARLYFKISLSFVLGSAWIFALLLIFSIFSLDISYILIIIPLLCIGLSTYHDHGSFAGFELPNNQALSRSVIILMIIIAIVISIITLGIGDPVLYTGDSPDHMAYIRTVARSHEVFPGQFIYRNGGMLTRDIRRGLLHGMLGTLVTATSRTDVLPVWPLISWIGSLFLLLGIFCLGIQLFNSQAIGISGAILYLLFYQRGFAGHQLVMNAYGFYFAKIYLLSFFTFVLLYLRTCRKEFLFMTALSSFAAVGAHVSYIMILLFIAFVLSIMEWFQAARDSRRELVARILPPLFVSIVIVNLPYLLIRYFRDYNPVNEIHTHAQGMLFFTENLAVVNPIIFFQQTGHLMTVALFAVVILWRSSRNDRNLRSILGLVVAVYLLAFNPLWVPFIMNRITYLIVRFSVAVPSMLLVAYLIRSLWLGWRGKSDSPSRPMTVFGCLVVLIILVPGFISNFSDFAYAGRSRDIRESRSCLDLSGLYSAINKNIPAGSIIASDPITSYSILAFTDQYVVCTYDQHSTPNDSTAVDRIIACRDLYLPGTSCGDKIGMLEAYDADYVVINGRIPTYVRSQYWRPDRKSAEANAIELSRCGESFDLLYLSESLYLFEYTGAGETESGGTPGAARDSTRFLLDELSGDYDQLIESGAAGIYIRSWGQESDRIARGDTLRIYVDWVTSGIDEPGTYIIYVRFDTGFEKGPLYNASYGKIYRKIFEKIRGETYRFRNDVLPFEGIYPPDTWASGSVMRQYIDVPIPGYIADGVYTISIKMDNAPHYSNLVMRDLIRDDDFYDGPDLMKVVIE